MKRKSMFIALALGLGMTMVLMWLLGFSGAGLQAVRAASYTVCPTGSPTCDYNSVQSAVDKAGDGDVIKVAAGTYTGINNKGGHAQVVYINKSVTIRGGYTTAFTDPPDPDANPTTLDAEGQGRVLYITGNISPTIEGLRITGGDAAAIGSNEEGGGVLIDFATATLKNNLVFSNTANWGGGLHLGNSAATLIGNTIISNTAVNGGGGLIINRSDAILTNNTISANNADYGGGLVLDHSAATLSRNIVTSNTAIKDGGGLMLHESAATLSNNTISANTAGWGGGLNLNTSPATLNGNTIISNSANSYGGGLILGNSDATLTNNVVSDNQANNSSSGLHIQDSSPRLLHNTIARNTGGGIGLSILSNSSVTMTNTILVDQTVGINVQSGSTATLEATLWGSGPWANGDDWQGGGAIITTDNLWGDPVFVDPDTGDYHIGPNSDAIDQGVDAGVTNDIDFHPRPYQAPDIGADEYWPPGALKFVYLPIVLR